MLTHGDAPQIENQRSIKRCVLKRSSIQCSMHYDRNRVCLMLFYPKAFVRIARHSKEHKSLLLTAKMRPDGMCLFFCSEYSVLTYKI